MHTKIAKHSNDEFANLVKGIVVKCVRNTILEDYHSQQVPIDDERMKAFMIEVVDNIGYWIALLFSDEDIGVGETKTSLSDFAFEQLVKAGKDYAREWDDPKIPKHIINKENHYDR